MSTSIAEPFPSVSLLPKKESTALSFVTKYPNYDGRGVVIAIFDSGVDPGARGLQVTSDGKPKIIDVISGTGDQHVDTSTVVTLDQSSSGEKTITGLTGRKLKIPESWNNPSGKFHIGVKNGYELYPRDAGKRVATEYQAKSWDPFLRDCKAKALRELQEFESKEAKESKESKESKVKEDKTEKDKSPSSSAEESSGGKAIEPQFEKEDLQAKVDVLNSLETNYSDLGPTYDCVVFHDGNMWRACIDTTQCGDLEKCTVLGPYRDTLKYATFTDRDQLNYTVNIYDEGKLLEINCVSSDHGTHVASIAAGNFPDEPEKNGIAPGAQIISINIADARLGGNMETGKSMIQACIRAIEAGADVINMSFGEPIKWGSGRVHDMMNEVVEKHGIIFCTSAGNEGPSLSTVTSASIPSSIMGIGAYVSPEMMEAEYSTREKIPGRILTFSSKDPNIEEGQSVCMCAPGAAIASVSNSTLAKSVLMNGTSMASPNAVGGVALVLSGLKQKNLPYSPFSVRRAFENTALKPSTYDPFAMGNGLIQVEPAFEHAVKYSDCIERDVRFDISCSGKQGIYLREMADVIRPSVQLISITPLYLNHDEYDNKIKVNFEMKLSLTCDAPWVTAPSYLLLTSYKRNITVKVDPTGLSTGVHITHLKAYDSTCPEKGFIFKVPITVVKPIPFESTAGPFSCARLDLGPGIQHYTPIIPPAGSTVALITVKNIGSQATGTVFVNCRQLIPQSFGKNLSKDILLSPQAQTTIAFPIVSHKTLDVSITKWWSSLGDCSLSYVLEFAGCQPGTNHMRMLASESVYQLDFFGSAPLDYVQPKISLNYCLTPLKPVEDKISPLTSRDVLPQGRQVYQLLLTYNFNLSKPSDVTIICPLLDSLLYENEYESQLWMVFNAHKQFMLSGDAVTDRGVHKFDRYMKKLDKGDYTVFLQIRHDNVNLLKKLTKIPVHLCTKLASPVSLDIYPTYKELLIEGKQFNTKQIQAQRQVPAYVKSLAPDKVPKNLPNSIGTYLCGSICLAKEDFRKKAEEYPFYYMLDGEPSKKSTNGKDADEKPVEEQYKDALIDLKANWIPKFPGTVCEPLIADLGDIKPEKKQAITLAKIQALMGAKDKENYLVNVVELAEEIIKAQNINEFYGSLMIAKNKSKAANEEATKKDETLKSLEKQKDRICEALNYKGLAILDILHPESSEDSAKAEPSPLLAAREKYSMRDVEDIIQDLKKLTDITNTKFHKLVYRHSLAKAQYGRALKAIMKQQETKPSKELDEQFIECANKLGWEFCANHFKRSLTVKYPPSYRLF